MYLFSFVFTFVLLRKLLFNYKLTVNFYFIIIFVEPFCQIETISLEKREYNKPVCKILRFNNFEKILFKLFIGSWYRMYKKTCKQQIGVIG